MRPPGHEKPFHMTVDTSRAPKRAPRRVVLGGEVPV